MKQLFANNAAGRLNAGITDVQTNFALQAGQGALFPNTATGKEFRVTAIDSSGNIEIIKVTAHTGGSDSFTTVVRGQEGTTPIAFLAGDKIQLRLTKETMEIFARAPTVVTVTGDETLDYEDFNTRRVVTASANITLPAVSAVDVGDFVEFKSLTTGHVRLTPNGADTIDGVNALWRLPSFCDCRLEKVAVGQWALTRKPDVEIGDLVFWPVNSATPKAGYVFADNVLEARATLAGLFAVYSTVHGAGDGVTTFGKPDMRDRVPIGRGDMGGAAAGLLTNGGTDSDTAGFDSAVIGTKGGSQKSQRHTHLQDPHDHDDGADLAAFNTNGGIPPYAHSGAARTGSTTAVNQNALTGQSGNIQPGLVGNWLVKT